MAASCCLVSSDFFTFAEEMCCMQGQRPRTSAVYPGGFGAGMCTARFACILNDRSVCCEGGESGG